MTAGGWKKRKNELKRKSQGGFRRVFYSGWVRIDVLSRTVVDWKWRETEKRKREKVKEMNLYRDETKRVEHGRKNGFVYICIYVYMPVKVRQRKIKANVWKQKEQWETKGNILQYTNSKVVSQSHCCATPQEYEWAKSSPRFIIFFRLCVSETARRTAEKKREEKEIKFAPWFFVYISFDWKYLFLLRAKEIFISINYLHAIPHYYWKINWRYVLSNCSYFILHFYFSYKMKTTYECNSFVRNNVFLHIKK